jgi:glycosyltransferase involved in cell wall biosynthesis
MSKRVLITFPAWFPNRQPLIDMIQRELTDYEIHYFVFSPREKGRVWNMEGAMEVTPEVIPGISLTLFKERHFNLNFGLRKRIASVAPDLVIIGGWDDLACFSTKSFACKHRIPVIAWVAGLNNRRPPGFVSTLRKWVSYGLAKRFVKGHNFVFARGTKAKRDVVSMGVPEERCVVVKQTIDEQLFDWNNNTFTHETRMLERCKIGLDDRPVFLCVSQLLPRKGINCLLSAFRELRRLTKDFNMLLIGNGPLSRTVAGFCRDNRGFVWIPRVSYQSIPRYYFMSDCFVFPTSYEDWGNVINESHCAKLPVITSDSASAVIDLVKHQETGLVYKAGETSVLVGLMRYALKHPERMRQLAENGYALIQKTWNTKCAAEIWCKYIKIALGEC